MKCRPFLANYTRLWPTFSRKSQESIDNSKANNRTQNVRVCVCVCVCVCVSPLNRMSPFSARRLPLDAILAILMRSPLWLSLCLRFISAHLRVYQNHTFRSGPGKPNPRKASSWAFPGGIPEQTFNVNRACFPKEKHQNSQKWAKFMNFSFWPFLWFGLLGRLLTHRHSLANFGRRWSGSRMGTV